MAKSDRIRLRDVRQLLRLQRELSELRPLSHEWKQRLLDRVLRLIPAKIAFLPELRAFRSGEQPQTCSVAAIGWLSEEGQSDFARWAAHGDYEADDPSMAAMMKSRRRLTTRRRLEQVSDEVWYASPVVNEHLCISELDDNMKSIVRLDDDGWIIGMGLFRDQRDRVRFTRRERALLHLVHSEIVPVYRRYAESKPRSNAHSLTPRLRETLDHLLAGHSERRIAHRMYISPHTVHGYIKQIYRHFDVSSRAELMAKCLDPERQNEADEPRGSRTRDGGRSSGDRQLPGP